MFEEHTFVPIQSTFARLGRFRCRATKPRPAGKITQLTSVRRARAPRASATPSPPPTPSARKSSATARPGRRDGVPRGPLAPRRPHERGPELVHPGRADARRAEHARRRLGDSLGDEQRAHGARAHASRGVELCSERRGPGRVGLRRARPSGEAQDADADGGGERESHHGRVRG